MNKLKEKIAFDKYIKMFPQRTFSIEKLFLMVAMKLLADNKKSTPIKKH
jgi:hypothetical protein